MVCVMAAGRCECGRVVYAKGVCSRCYLRAHRAINPWPATVEACRCCGVKVGQAAYRARGLCYRCYRSAELDGSLEGYPLRHHAKQAHLLPKGQGLCLRLCRAHGAQWVAARLAVPKQRVYMWAQGQRPVPVRYVRRMERLV